MRRMTFGLGLRVESALYLFGVLALNFQVALTFAHCVVLLVLLGGFFIGHGGLPFIGCDGHQEIGSLLLLCSVTH